MNYLTSSEIKGKKVFTIENDFTKKYTVLNYIDIFEGKIEVSKGIIYRECYKEVYSGTVQGRFKSIHSALEIIKDIMQLWPIEGVCLRTHDIIFIDNDYYIFKGTTFERIIFKSSYR